MVHGKKKTTARLGHLVLEQNLRCQVAEGFISRPGTRLQGSKPHLLNTLYITWVLIGYTLWKINIEPENDGLEDDIPFPGVYSQVPC